VGSIGTGVSWVGVLVGSGCKEEGSGKAPGIDISSVSIGTSAVPCVLIACKMLQKIIPLGVNQVPYPLM